MSTLVPRSLSTWSENFIDDFDWTYVSSCGPRVREAWETAVKLTHQLAGHVSLVLDRSSKTRVISSIVSCSHGSHWPVPERQTSSRRRPWLACGVGSIIPGR